MTSSPFAAVSNEFQDSRGPKGDVRVQLCVDLSSPARLNFDLFGSAYLTDTRSSKASSTTLIEQGFTGRKCFLSEFLGVINNEGYVTVKFNATNAKTGEMFDQIEARADFDGTAANNDWYLVTNSCGLNSEHGIFMKTSRGETCNRAEDIPDEEYVQFIYRPKFPDAKCSFKTSELNFLHGTVKIGESIKDSNEQSISIDCNMMSSVKLSLSPSTIDLGGGLEGIVCIYNEQCFSQSNTSVSKNIDNESVKLSTKINGIPNIAGEYSGSAILTIEYK